VHSSACHPVSSLTQRISPSGYGIVAEIWPGMNKDKNLKFIEKYGNSSIAGEPLIAEEPREIQFSTQAKIA
jgi:hypothetical protein